MNYDKNAFLAGLAVGMQLRGWHIGGGGGGANGQTTFFPWAVAGSFPFSTPEEYAAYVATIPEEEDSEGGFSWSPSLAELTAVGVYYPKHGIQNAYGVFTLNSGNGFTVQDTGGRLVSIWTAGGGGVVINVTDPPPKDGAARGAGPYGISSLTFVAPVSGTYTLLGGASYISGYWQNLGEKVDGEYPGGETFPVATSYAAGASQSGARGASVTYNIGTGNNHLYTRAGNAGSPYMLSEIHASAAYPTFWIKPASSAFDGVRASMVSGDLGVLRGGIAVRVYHGYVVDETAGTYTNPATGVARSYAGWTYNYPARRMVLNMGEGNPAVTVTWGDYKMTILEGATEQVFYYML